MKIFTYLVIIMTFLLTTQTTRAEAPSAFGSGFDVQDFFKPFTLKDITPENQQKWPYYKYVSAHWAQYSLHNVDKIQPAPNPTKLAIADEKDRLDLNGEWKDGTFIDSLQSTQVKGFVVLKDNVVLAEYYDNGFMVDGTNLLQSASKTYAGVIMGRLIDEGLINPKKKVRDYLKDFKKADVGAATVQQILDMTSGLPTLLDFHTPNSPGQLWEVEIGLQPGKTTGHRKTIKETKIKAKPGKEYNYTDINTDILALLAEQVTGKKYAELLTELFEAFGSNHGGSIARNSDGTVSPCYGISTSARDYALFHQWIAQGKAPKSYYKSAMDTDKTLFSENETGQLLGGGITYASQTYYLAEHDVLYSSGSFGQLGYSDLQDGISVVFLQDWAVNAELDKFFETRDRALAIITYLRSKAQSGFENGRIF